jgi:hypothetical protein
MLAAALVLLNVSLTFVNIWPTPYVRWDGQLSFELAVCVAALALASRFGKTASRRMLRWLAAVWVLLVIGRYAAVTAFTIYGRDINLFWDIRHGWAVAGMLARVAPPRLILSVVAVALLAPLLMYVLLRWALGRVVDAVGRPIERRTLALAAATLMIWFAGQRVVDSAPTVSPFAKPVLQSYGQQVRLLVSDLTPWLKTVPAPRPLDSDLSRLGRADVFLIFVESYGAVSYDRPEFAAALQASRAQLENDVGASSRRVVSAFVESPTFGGSSWLAHVSLMTGVDVRDENTNALVMAQTRDTLVTAFSRRGYRTVAAMPGLWHPWPEGAFYRFDDIYARARLDYRGPRFGWWFVPDQFTVARMDALELDRVPRQPVFMFFPTISTHAPFGPTAPYESDWPRLLGDEPYAGPALEEALARKPDLLNLGPSYVHALDYTYSLLGGYLRMRADRDFVMIVLGDHQPPAAVSGPGAPWDVPVHVIASRGELLDRLRGHGFRDGLAPPRTSLGRMHTLLPVLLDAFGNVTEIRAAR